MHAWTAAPVVDGLMGMMLMMMAVRIGTSMRWKWMSTKINIKAFWLKYYFNKKHFNNVQKSNESDFYSSQKQWAWPNILQKSADKDVSQHHTTVNSTTDKLETASKTLYLVFPSQYELTLCFVAASSFRAILGTILFLSTPSLRAFRSSFSFLVTWGFT